MAQALPQQQHVATAASPALGAVAAGGPIADLQRSIAERMTAFDTQPLPESDVVLHRASRLAGPVLLAVAYAGVALWWF